MTRPGTAAAASRWTTIDGEPSQMRYIVLGEEGDEELMIHGHALGEDQIRKVITHAGFGRLFADVVVDGVTYEPFVTIDELSRFETWAREVLRCSRHWWLPRQVRQPLARLGEWLRDVRFFIAYRHNLPQPKIRDRHLIADCWACEHVDHHRTCTGCGWCSGDGTVPPWWDWATPTEAPTANADRPGYLPVTVVEVTC